MAPLKNVFSDPLAKIQHPLLLTSGSMGLEVLSALGKCIPRGYNNDCIELRPESSPSPSGYAFMNVSLCLSFHSDPPSTTQTPGKETG